MIGKKKNYSEFPFLLVASFGWTLPYLPLMAISAILITVSKQLRLSISEFFSENYGSLKNDYRENKNAYLSQWVVFPLIIAVENILSTLSRLLIDSNQDYLTSLNFYEGLMMIVIGAPLFEEIFFRKYILNFCLRYRPKVAILISAVIFSAVHGSVALAIIPIGVYFSYFALRTGRLWLTTLMHFTNNFLFFCLIWADKASLLGPHTKTQENILEIGCSVLCLIFALLAYLKLRKQVDFKKELLMRGELHTELDEAPLSPRAKSYIFQFIVAALVLPFLIGVDAAGHFTTLIFPNSQVAAFQNATSKLSTRMKYEIVALGQIEKTESGERQIAYSLDCEETRSEGLDCKMNQTWVTKSKTLHNKKDKILCDVEIRYHRDMSLEKIEPGIWGRKSFSKGLKYSFIFNTLKKSFVSIDKVKTQTVENVAETLYYNKRKFTQMTTESAKREENAQKNKDYSMFYGSDYKEQYLEYFPENDQYGLKHSNAKMPTSFYEGCELFKTVQYTY